MFNLIWYGYRSKVMRYNAIVDVIQLFCLEKNLLNLFALKRF